jgi:dTDP-4-amino-4,6-dideoxygalactose transaminase
VIRTKARDAIFAQFARKNIARAIHYPIPIHLQDAYASLGHRRGSFPVAELAADEILSLPIYPQLTEAQQDEVIEAVLAAL